MSSWNLSILLNFEGEDFNNFPVIQFSMRGRRENIVEYKSLHPSINFEKFSGSQIDDIDFYLFQDNISP